MSNKPLGITTPVGRLVGGSLYEPRTTDFDGKPLMIKTGANAGKPRVEFSFGVAIPKTPGATHWASESWGAPIWALAHAAFPAGEAQRRDFAWKITDGDSTELNKRNKRPCDAEGYKGHWVIWFSGGTAPRVYNANGTQLILEKDAVKPGYYVQVFGNVTDNKPSQSPGLYINHSMVAFAAYGTEIQFGPDVSQAGFGQNTALPAGASLAPPPGGGIPSTGAPTPPPPPGAAPAPLIPSLAAPMPPAPPAPAPVAPVAPARQMTAAANGATYEACIAVGWTDATLIANGMMLAAPPLPVGSVPTPVPPAPIVAAPPPLPVTPNPAILGIPAGTVAPPPPALPGRVMLPAAGGVSYDDHIKAGWTDAMLIQHGKMAA